MANVRATGVDLTGLWVPLVTPFTERDEVDVVALEHLAERVLDQGATGLVALGTTGEPATLNTVERHLVIEVCDAACRRKGRRLIIGAGSNSTRATLAEIDLLPPAATAAALLVVVPYYTRPPEQAVADHFRLVADESPLPLVIYNIPYRTGRGLGAGTLADLASHPNIAGVKQAVGALDRDTLDLLRRKPPSFHVLAGDDAFVAPTILMGGAGAIAASAHVCTPMFALMVAAAVGGESARARALAGSLLPVVDAGYAEPSPAVWKAALHAAGEIASPALRSPMTAASAGAVEALTLAVAAAGRDPG
jgi:4-hydroxy-tetrahydrodipicolinate synthase